MTSVATLAAADGPQKVSIPSNHPIYHKRYNARDYPLDTTVHRGYVLRYDVPSKFPEDDPDPADVDAWIEHGTFASLPLSNRHNLVHDAKCNPSGFVISASRDRVGVEVEFALRTDTPEGREAMEKLRSGEFRALSLTHDGNRPLEVALCTKPYRDRCVITADADGKHEATRLRFTGHGPESPTESWIRVAGEPVPAAAQRPVVTASDDAKAGASPAPTTAAPVPAAVPGVPDPKPLPVPPVAPDAPASETKFDGEVERTLLKLLGKLQGAPQQPPQPVTINNYMHPGAAPMPYTGHVPSGPLVSAATPAAPAPAPATTAATPTPSSTVCVHARRAHRTAAYRVWRTDRCSAHGSDRHVSAGAAARDPAPAQRVRRRGRAPADAV